MGQYAGPGHGPGGGAGERQSGQILFRKPAVIGTIVLEALEPENVGRLLAFYEARTIYEAFLWGINPFDQFGVELGKVTAGTIRSEMAARNGESGSRFSCNRSHQPKLSADAVQRQAARVITCSIVTGRNPTPTIGFLISARLHRCFSDRESIKYGPPGDSGTQP